jgi:hypothetical protein
VRRPEHPSVRSHRDPVASTEWSSDRIARRRVLERSCRGSIRIHPKIRPTMADPINLSDGERTRLEQRRDRLMKLLKDGDGEPLDAEDRADLTQEWHKIDQLLQRR